MKKQYQIKKTCSHCGHRFAFQNTDKEVIKEEYKTSVYGSEPTLIGWEYYIPCPSCGYKILWLFESESEVENEEN
jgi:DNA-directed RNA polymerase subunit RPC12/RpoP